MSAGTRVQVIVKGEAAYLFKNIKSKKQAKAIEMAIILLAKNGYFAKIFFKDIDVIDCVLDLKKRYISIKKWVPTLRVIS